MLGHVTKGSDPWIDEGIDSLVDDVEEKGANEYGCEVLTGQKVLGFKPALGMTAHKLVGVVKVYGKKNGIAPGVVALMYARSAHRWGAAQNALKQMGEATGAKAIIDKALHGRLNVDELPETSARFLNVLSEAA